MQQLNKRKIGNIGERIAEDHLIKKGYQILDKNYHSRTSEIDLIVLKSDLVWFVEVKYRKFLNSDFPIESAVGSLKYYRIVKGMYHWLKNNTQYEDKIGGIMILYISKYFDKSVVKSIKVAL